MQRGCVLSSTEFEAWSTIWCDHCCSNRRRGNTLPHAVYPRSASETASTVVALQNVLSIGAERLNGPRVNRERVEGQSQQASALSRYNLTILVLSIAMPYSPTYSRSLVSQVTHASPLCSAQAPITDRNQRYHHPPFTMSTSLYTPIFPTSDDIAAKLESLQQAKLRHRPTSPTKRKLPDSIVVTRTRSRTRGVNTNAH